MKVVIFNNKLVKKQYSIKRSRLFFTFPKTEITAEELIQRLIITRYFGDLLEYIIIGGEKHKDGTPHLHCYIQLSKSMNFTLNGLKKALRIKHFNDAGAIRSILKVLLYITKEGTVTTYPTGLDYKGMIEAYKNKKPCKSGIVRDKMLEVPSTTDAEEFCADLIDDDFLGGYTLFNTKKIIDGFKIYHGTKLKNLPREPIVLNLTATWMLMQNIATQAIWTWLSTRLNNVMKHGDLHLFIWGPTKNGKNTLINYLLEKGLRLYFIPKKVIYYDGIETQKKWDFAVMDEVRGGDRTVQEWNQWCDSIMSLPLKGKAPYLKCQVIPTIILSNYCPERLFSKVATEQPDIMEAFVRRWEVVEVGGTFGAIDLP